MAEPNERCGFTAGDASRYHALDMEADHRAAFAAHLPACRTCRSAVYAQERVDELVPELPVYRAPAALPTRRRRRGVGVAFAAAAAAVVIAVVLARAAGSRARFVDEALAADSALIEGIVRVAPPAPAARSAEARVPWLGFVTCGEAIAPRVDGVYVCALKRGSPLSEAGVRAGDVLLEIDGERIDSEERMFRQIARRELGDTVSAAFRERNGRVFRARAPVTPRRLAPNHPFDLEWSPALLAYLDKPVPPGQDVRQIFVTLSDSAAARLGIRSGVLVAREPDRSVPAESILALVLYLFGPGGLRAGDVITEVHGRPVRTSWDALKILINEKPDSFLIAVERAGLRTELHYRRTGAAMPEAAGSAAPRAHDSQPK